MSLDKSILHGKDHRKPYYKSGRFDYTCRPNGGCPYCAANRLFNEKRRKFAADEQFKDFQENHLTKIRYTA